MIHWQERTALVHINKTEPKIFIQTPEITERRWCASRDCWRHGDDSRLVVAPWRTHWEAADSAQENLKPKRKASSVWWDRAKQTTVVRLDKRVKHKVYDTKSVSLNEKRIT